VDLVHLFIKPILKCLMFGLFTSPYIFRFAEIITRFSSTNTQTHRTYITKTHPATRTESYIYIYNHIQQFYKTLKPRSQLQYHIIHMMINHPHTPKNVSHAQTVESMKLIDLGRSKHVTLFLYRPWNPLGLRERFKLSHFQTFGS
jgi:hypothetical protein